jgi:hypothetical protein
MKPINNSLRRKYVKKSLKRRNSVKKSLKRRKSVKKRSKYRKIDGVVKVNCNYCNIEFLNFEDLITHQKITRHVKNNEIDVKREKYCDREYKINEKTRKY